MSTTPIDGIWTAEQCQTFYNEQELQSCTGHTIAHCCLDFWVPDSKPEFRFSKTPKVCSDACPTQVSWLDCASPSGDWLKALENLEFAWGLWSSDIQKWLSETGVLSNEAFERPLGSLPTLRSGSDKVSFKQSIAERQLRRLTRRLREAQRLQHLGQPIPSRPLWLRLCSDPLRVTGQVTVMTYGKLTMAPRSIVRNSACRPCLLRLSAVRVRNVMHKFEGSCRWLRKEEAIPTVLQNEEGTVLCQPAEAAKALFSFWANTFGCNTRTTPEAPF